MSGKLDRVIAEAVLCAASVSNLNIIKRSNAPELNLVGKLLEDNITRLESLYQKYADATVADDNFRLSAVLIKGKLHALRELNSIIKCGD